VVITSEGSRSAVRSGDSPGRDDDPLVASQLASGLVVLRSTETVDLGDVGQVVPVKVEGGSGGGNAHTAGSNVLRETSVVVATLGDGTRGKDSDILPWGWVPVRIVVTLLIALKTTTSSTVVLTSVDGRLTDVLVGDEQTLVTLAGVTVAEVRGRLVIAILELLDGVERQDVVGRSIISGTVTEPRSAHVLHDHLAINVGVLGTATVLGSPLDLEQRSGVVGHQRTPTITSLIVVLGIEKTSLVVLITAVAIVRTTRVVHVDVRHSGGQQTTHDEENGRGTHLRKCYS